MGKHVSVSESYGQTVPVALNSDLFQWAVENLLKNALDAMNKEEGKINVRSGMKNGGGIFIEIEDNGRGIEKSDWKRVFKPGFSTKKRGWGLGLTLSKRIVEEYHGGRVFVKESLPGKGTVIRIELHRY
jgi:signal transduction histidine kinase